MSILANCLVFSDRCVIYTEWSGVCNVCVDVWFLKMAIQTILSADNSTVALLDLIITKVSMNKIIQLTAQNFEECGSGDSCITSGYTGHNTVCTRTWCMLQHSMGWASLLWLQ